jgi:hypothetical protein
MLAPVAIHTIIARKLTCGNAIDTIMPNRPPRECLNLSFGYFAFTMYCYTAISIKVVHEQSGKVEYERERLLGIAMKIH